MPMIHAPTVAAGYIRGVQGCWGLWDLAFQDMQTLNPEQGLGYFRARLRERPQKYLAWD